MARGYWSGLRHSFHFLPPQMQALLCPGFFWSSHSLKRKKKEFKEKDKSEDSKHTDRKFQKDYSQEISIQGGPLDEE